MCCFLLPQIIVMYLEVLGSTGKKQLVQCAWNFMNDSLRSDVFMRFHSESIACACIYLAARQCQVPLPNNPPWFWLFAVDEDEIQQICLSILRLYARSKVSKLSLQGYILSNVRLCIIIFVAVPTIESYTNGSPIGKCVHDGWGMYPGRA